MSHFVKVKSKLTDKDLLVKGLERLGYKVEIGDFVVTEYGQSSTAQIKLDKALGLSLQEDGTYSFVGDPYHATNQKVRNLYNKLDNFTKELTTAYSIEEAIKNLGEHQFFCTENTEGSVGEDGMITMCFESHSA